MIHLDPYLGGCGPHSLSHTQVCNGIQTKSTPKNPLHTTTHGHTCTLYSVSSHLAQRHANYTRHSQAHTATPH